MSVENNSYLGPVLKIKHPDVEWDYFKEERLSHACEIGGSTLFVVNNISILEIDRDLYIYDVNDTRYQDLTKIDVEYEIKRFKSVFATEIRQAEQEFGADNVEVAWVWLNYQS